MKATVLLLTTAAWLPLNLAATPVGAVKGAKDPVWVERAGSKLPVKVGMTLEGGDKVTTGDAARVLVKLKEGSELRLGGGAEMEVATSSAPSSLTRAPCASAARPIRRSISESWKSRWGPCRLPCRRRTFGPRRPRTPIF